MYQLDGGLHCPLGRRGGLGLGNWCCVFGLGLGKWCGVFWKIFVVVILLPGIIVAMATIIALV